MKMPNNQLSGDQFYDYGNSPYITNETNMENNDTDDLNNGQDNDFAEYLWMENEEEFDLEVLQRLEEEALMEQCIDAMLSEAEEASATSTVNARSNSAPGGRSTLNDPPVSDIQNLTLGTATSDVVKASNLNPLAAEFIPNGVVSCNHISHVQPASNQSVGMTPSQTTPGTGDFNYKTFF